MFRLDTLRLLSPEECTRLRDGIIGLQDSWEHRHAELPFYTLGAASYLDASHGRFGEYREKARTLNPLLVTNFRWFYDRFAEALAEYSGTPCRYDYSIAYPGFHIFLGDQSADPSGHRHVDLQCSNIDWSSYRWVDTSLQFSVTLPIRLPADGGGLYVWNISERVLNRMTPEERQEHIAANQRPSYHPYKIGDLVIHSGQYLHQIARLRTMKPGDERFTLQAHAVATDQGWVLYW